MDFVADELFNGHRTRALTVLDNFTRESLVIAVGQRLTGEDVVHSLRGLHAAGRRPRRIQVDNGSEFISKALDRWADKHNVTLDFSRPGEPTDDPFMESFNGSFHDECLNVHWFLSIDDAREKVERWRTEYNQSRPHSSLCDLTPEKFRNQLLEPARIPV